MSAPVLFADRIRALRERAATPAAMSKALPQCNDADAFETVLHLWKTSDAFDPDEHVALEHAGLHQLCEALLAALDDDDPLIVDATLQRLEASRANDFLDVATVRLSKSDSRCESLDRVLAARRALYLTALGRGIEAHLRKAINDDPNLQALRADIALIKHFDDHATRSERARLSKHDMH